MRIGEAAAVSGCHQETIRYYERVGLIAGPDRRANGYRNYTSEDIDRLRFVVRGRGLGFSLEEIRRLLVLAERSDLSCSEVDQLAREQLGEAKKRIKELQRIARELERTIQACAKQSCGECSILDTLLRRPKRRRNSSA